MSTDSTAPLFESGYFRRTIGTVVSQPDVALTELVANAWDAGATLVEVTVPEKPGDVLQVVDDGAGMTEAEFQKRWRTLAYDRLTHQGRMVEFPPGVERRARVAYGRNGIGRHAMFCFAESYEIETQKGGGWVRFRVDETSGEAPLRIEKLAERRSSGHGTTVRCTVTRQLPSAQEMRDVLSARFMYDPEFTLTVNGQAVPLEEHSGLVVVKEFEFAPGMKATMHVFESAEAARTKFQHGVAFWVSRRLVGRPSWAVAGRSLLDGRTTEAKRLTFIVQVDELPHEHVAPDWTGFMPTPQVRMLERMTAEQVDGLLRQMMADRVDTKVQGVIDRRRERVRALAPLAQLEVAGLAHDIAVQQPLVADEVLIAAVDALIRLEDTRSGQQLIQKLAALDRQDVEGLNRLLDDWTVRDALAVLDEVGKRIRVVEAIEKLAVDPQVDELHTLHPLVTQARWVFGPEYDTPHYISNITIRRAVERICGKSVTPAGFENPKKRPDLIFLRDRTIGATAVEEVGDEGLATIERILLIELKRGGHEIGRTEMTQAVDYAQDLMLSGDIEGAPRIDVFVVGARVSPRIASRQKLAGSGDVDRGFVIPCTFDRLVRTAGRRLHRLRGVVEPMFPEGADSQLIKGALRQQQLL